MVTLPGKAWGEIPGVFRRTRSCWEQGHRWLCVSVCLSVCVQGAAEHSSQLPGAHHLPQGVNSPPETAPGVLQAPLCFPEFLFGVRRRALEPRAGRAASTGPWVLLRVQVLCT